MAERVILECEDIGTCWYTAELIAVSGVKMTQDFSMTGDFGVNENKHFPHCHHSAQSPPPEIGLDPWSILASDTTHPSTQGAGHISTEATV
ncbi:hypothetical protein AALO_G00197100 [Alosa alosa]|uniref:Uncharacterized protein n=1 Tax=Alosa alosa TaxID=278164 RepID=A0AAV6G690_9TELE|nr:hypothetical protein AALO_G00197100 [Alosa alosa]